MSVIYIRDGVGCINHEPVTTDVDHKDAPEPEPGDKYAFHLRRMRIDCGSGYVLSIVFSTGTCSSNCWFDGSFQEEVETAEIAILNKHNALLPIFEEEWGDTVKGYCDAQEILYWLIRTRQWVKENA